ncbi:DUF2029 domain-containing protein [Maribius pontilimi]|uniref:DUF2029 domain-containing protein n=1 Tax=Palleronia pontilimi TaxID=1964209 RepID=A0A934I8Z2_9RHOB|nr:glycosyltransferase family 87 protein [Palleronia pontilimi]MBJ3762669.1 DUF2029 domain-containing protein [Palleronia pontilimi]
MIRPTAPPGDRRLVHLVLLAGVAWLCLQAAMMQPTSADLLALWLAASALADGAPELVYASGDLFTLRPPPDWTAMAVAAGYAGPVYPYLYPPLWAALLAPFTSLVSFTAFAGAMHAVHVALIAAMVWLAWRAAGRVLPLAGFLFAGLAIIHLSYAGAIALSVGQPQIWVAFLTVLAIERLGAGRQAASGAALAVATALKLYPLVFTVAYLARGDWRALGSFAVTGGALGLLSLALGGPALHAAFLGQIAAVSQTAITLPLNFALDGIVAHALGAGKMVETVLTPGHIGPNGGIGVTAKPPLWGLIGKAALLAVLAAAALAFRRRPGDVMLWPAMMVGVSLLAPLAWGYHFLAALAFAPALIPRWGVAPVLLLFAPLSVSLLQIDALAVPLLRHLSVIGAVAMTLFALACLWRPVPTGRRLPAAQPR